MTETKPVAGSYCASVARNDMKAPELYDEKTQRYCYCPYKGLEFAQVFSDIDFSGFRAAKPRAPRGDLKITPDGE